MACQAIGSNVRIIHHRMGHYPLEELVPQDHFYRHVERTLDLSFVRELVQETYAGGGRPSIDPVVFWHRCNS
jgi:transposase